MIEGRKGGSSPSDRRTSCVRMPLLKILPTPDSVMEPQLVQQGRRPVASDSTENAERADRKKGQGSWETRK